MTPLERARKVVQKLQLKAGYEWEVSVIAEAIGEATREAFAEAEKKYLDLGISRAVQEKRDRLKAEGILK